MYNVHCTCEVIIGFPSTLIKSQAGSVSYRLLVSQLYIPHIPESGFLTNHSSQLFYFPKNKLADILTVIPLNGYSQGKHWWDIWSNPILGLPYCNSSVQDSWRDYLVFFRTPRNLLLLLWRRLHFKYLIQPTHLPHPLVWQGWQDWQIATTGPSVSEDS